jgi:UDP-galactopyranose mutase
VRITDRRPHLAGNAYDEFDANGVLVHRYGPHIFHTNSQRVFEYLSSRPVEAEYCPSIKPRYKPCLEV